MKTNRPQNGSVFVTMPAIIVFTVIAVLALTAVLNKATFTARQTHRILLARQAEFLANGAVERALDSLSNTGNPSATQKQTYTTQIAPIFSSADPTEEEGDEGIINATYKFSVKQADELAHSQIPPKQIRLSYLIIGQAEIPYRDSTLTHTVTRLCILTRDGGWIIMPIAG